MLSHRKRVETIAAIEQEAIWNDDTSWVRFKRITNLNAYNYFQTFSHWNLTAGHFIVSAMD